ncbi:LysR family transcriptional regulator [Actinopolymorpha sp. B11F2]|uniref:LysR family transcriptional regulator n=1 Tax=Actinopolymorpha sp. B11F2 TaxID=3160862 RepID=UPI0032E4212B
MEIENLRGFVAVVEHGHLGMAATSLRIPQSTLTRRIQRLEAELDCQLLDRSARPIAPSAAGRIIAEHARTVVGTADRATRQVRALLDGQGGTIRIGYVQSATFGWVARLLAVARRRKVDVELQAAPTIRQLEALHDHRVDAGVVRPSSATANPVGLRSAVLSRDTLHAVVPRRHSAARSDAVEPSDLAGEHLVLYPEQEGPGLRNLLDGWLARERLSLARWPVRIYDAWDAPSAAALAGAGAGIAILPGPLPPLPRTVTAVPLLAAPRLELALMWHPVNDSIIEPFATALTSEVATGT